MPKLADSITDYGEFVFLEMSKVFTLCKGAEKIRFILR